MMRFLADTRLVLDAMPNLLPEWSRPSPFRFRAWPWEARCAADVNPKASLEEGISGAVCKERRTQG